MVDWKTLFVIVAILFSNAARGQDALCGDTLHETPNENIKHHCDQQGHLVRVDQLFSNSANISRSTFFKNNKKVGLKVYNSKQVQTFEADFEELDDGSYIKTSYSIKPFRAYIKKKQHLRDQVDQILPETLATWFYKENTTKTDSKLVLYLEFIQGTDIPFRKTFYDDNEQVNFSEEYIVDNPHASNKVDVRIIGFTKFDSDNKVISDYRTEGPITFQQLYGSDLPPAKPLGVIVIDSGFETDHPDLLPHWYQNPNEAFNGLDNDGNGVIDDVYGAHQIQGGEATSNLRQSFLFNDKFRPIFSHGTHVASLAMQNIKGWSLAAFAGDYTNIDHLGRINDFMNLNGGRFVDMSFSFETPGGIAPPRQSFLALKNLIKNQSEALFFIAAGNSNSNLEKFPTFPVAWEHENMIVIGALASSDWTDTPNSDYATKAEFSDYGQYTVDIFAPGTDILAAFLGKDYGLMSGTSMAAPKVLNVVARVAESFPQIESQILKSALLLSVYIPDISNPLPCLSGGVAFESRMRTLLKHYSNGKSLKEAALQARLDAPPLEGEELNSQYFSQLEKLWSKANLLPIHP